MNSRKSLPSGICSCTQLSCFGLFAPRQISLKPRMSFVKLFRRIERRRRGCPRAACDGDARVGEKLALVEHRPAVGLVLDDLDDVAVGVVDEVILVADLSRADFVGHLNAVGSEIIAHVQPRHRFPARCDTGGRCWLPFRGRVRCVW